MFLMGVWRNGGLKEHRHPAWERQGATFAVR